MKTVLPQENSTVSEFYGSLVKADRPVIDRILVFHGVFIACFHSKMFAIVFLEESVSE